MNYDEEVVQDAQLVLELVATSVTGVYVALCALGEKSGCASLDECSRSEDGEVLGFLSEFLDALEGTRDSCESLVEFFEDHRGFGYHLRFWSGLQVNRPRLFGADLVYRGYAEVLADVHNFSAWVDRLKDAVDACFEATVEVVH